MYLRLHRHVPVDTSDMDTETHRDFCKQTSYLRYMHVEHLKMFTDVLHSLSHEARG